MSCWTIGNCKRACRSQWSRDLGFEVKAEEKTDGD